MEIHCVGRDSKTPAPQASPADRRTLAADAPRIVIIEDEFLVGWHLQTMLHDLNFPSVEVACDAQSGIELALRQNAELLLVDVNLGDGPDGIEAVRSIREHCDAPVIFITAYADEAHLRRIRSVTPDAPVLSKPVSPETLHATIRAWFPER